MPLDDQAGGVPALSPDMTVALDLSSKVGVAVGDIADPLPRFVTWDLSHLSYEDARFAGLQDRLADFLAIEAPTSMVIEAPMFLPVLLGKSNPKAVYQQLGMRAIARAEAFFASCSVSEIAAMTARDEVMGQFRFAKDRVKREVVAFCRRRGLKVTDHNAADAIILWFWRRQRMLGIRPCAGPLWQETMT